LDRSLARFRLTGKAAVRWPLNLVTIVAVGFAVSSLAPGCLKVDLQDGFPCSTDGRCPSPYQCTNHGCYREAPVSKLGSAGGQGGVAAGGGRSGAGPSENGGEAGVPSAGAGGIPGGGGSAGSAGTGPGTGGSVGTGGVGGAGGDQGGSGGTSGAGGTVATGGAGGAGGAAAGGATGAGGRAGTGGASGGGGAAAGGAGGAPTTCTTSGCTPPLVCERAAPASCADPSWPEWPMPNEHLDVTAGAPNAGGYTDNSDGTVTDKVTQLMWQQTAAPGTYTWSAALAYCTNLTLGGHKDWRLPAEPELISIIDYSVASGSVALIDAAAFPGTPVGLFWSSTPAAGSSSIAWVVVMTTGYTGKDYATNKDNVRCVR
jgi:hypothetical protein